MKKIILTGGSGFIGANLAQRLIHNGHEVHLLLRKRYHPWRLRAMKDDLHLHIVELQNSAQLKRVFATVRPDWIFHTAVYGAYSSQQNLEEMIETNIDGTAKLLDAAALVGFEAFVNTGSSSEYGYVATPPRETTLLRPNSNYALTKAAATHFAQLKAATTKLHIPTLRLYSVYGPYEAATRLIPTLLQHARKHRLPLLVGPTIARDFVYVDDVIDAYLKAAATRTTELGPIFNIGSGTQTTMRQLVALTKKDFHVTQKPNWGSMPNRAWDTSSWVANANKAKKQLHWKAKTPLKAGLHRTFEWLTEHQKEYGSIS
ncbi:MAG TPA: NAD-dependent epimerase/dehydratase family protein [Candidatus Saccharimonadia bacterium]|nr:NAD-dependent epimerase/dehydratase family protein [Candidatus Saccharimonadia bacterium]